MRPAAEEMLRTTPPSRASMCGTQARVRTKAEVRLKRRHHAPELGDRPRRERVELRGVGHVAPDGERAAAARAGARRRVLDLALGPRGADDVGALLREGERDRPPDAAPGAGHERDFAAEAEAV